VCARGDADGHEPARKVQRGNHENPDPPGVLPSLGCNISPSIVKGLIEAPWHVEDGIGVLGARRLYQGAHLGK
jgi:hypothetical protein